MKSRKHREDFHPERGEERGHSRLKENHMSKGLQVGKLKWHVRDGISKR